MPRFIIAVIFLVFVTLQISRAHADIKGAIDELRQETRVKDVFFQKGQIVEWIVGVLPNGKSQEGFALYACNILHSQKVVHKGTWIRVVDVLKVKSGAGFRDASLGRANCHTWRTKHP